MSAMRDAMWRQPAALRRLLADRARSSASTAADAFGYDVPGREAAWERLML